MLFRSIIFLVVVGYLVVGITMNSTVAFKQAINIVFYGFFVLLLICLIGQFYWKSLPLALWLAVILGLGSMWMIMAALSDLVKMSNSEAGYIETIIALLLFVGMTVVAISMPIKYIKSETV